MRLMVTLFALLLVGMTTSMLPPPMVAAPGAQTASPPVLLASEPADGASWAGEPVLFTFDQPLNVPPGGAVTVDPLLAGDVTVDGERLTFTPATALTPGERYQFTLGTDITSVDGVALNAPVIVTLVA
ncbi:MAG: hypothetical protein DCC55_08905, partial [Chloroflexi bacterium]